MIIKKIKIKNFRSIEFAELDVTNMNVFSGKNDSGKSNILKALNLFFNNETDYKKPFDFYSDFCSSATVPNKKAPEITIELLFVPPPHYKGAKNFIWKKTWRKNRATPFYNEKIVPKGSKNIPSSVNNWADKIRFRYVPAIKSDNYFASLLSELHNILSKSVDTELTEASKAFLETISSSTQQMLQRINEELGTRSEIMLPKNLSVLFEVLEFGTHLNGESIPLNQRGDGIKIRHIPSILKFLHDEENRVNSRGAIKVNTIWGYEEPENNLEMASAFSKSNELLEISRDLQLFITSHSPAFYLLDGDGVAVYYVTQKFNNSSYSMLKTKNIGSQLNEEMGLMPLVAPYIQEKQKEYQNLSDEVEKLKSNLNQERNTIYVEGISDKKIFTRGVEVLYPNEVINVVSQNSAGAAWVKKQLLAWQLKLESDSTGNAKACGIFDADDKGKEEQKKCHDLLGEVSKANRNVKAIKLVTPQHLINIFSKKGISIPIAIEELFPLDVWLHAKKQNWLEKRKLSECFEDIPNNQSLEDVVHSIFPDEKDNIYIFFKIKDSKKTKFADYLCDNKTMFDVDRFEGLRKTLEEIVDFFQKNE